MITAYTANPMATVTILEKWLADQYKTEEWP